MTEEIACTNDMLLCNCVQSDCLHTSRLSSMRGGCIALLLMLNVVLLLLTTGRCVSKAAHSCKNCIFIEWRHSDYTRSGAAVLASHVVTKDFQGEYMLTSIKESM